MKNHIATSIIMCACLLATSCSNNSDDATQQAVPQAQSTTVPVQDYTPSYDYNRSTTPDTTPFPQRDATEQKGDASAWSKSKLSAAYLERYERGYDDGEDDSVNHNGWHGQYDPSNRYKGKKRREYIKGYDEGYEDGYEDSKEEDGRSSDWDDYE